MEERRRSPRYFVTDDLFLIFYAKMERLGRIRDISEDGVSFEYIHSLTQAIDPQEEGEAHIDIFSYEPHFLMTQVHCKVVYNVRIMNEYFPYSRVEMMRCGLLFLELSNGQEEKLRTLLHSPCVRGRNRSMTETGVGQVAWI